MDATRASPTALLGNLWFSTHGEELVAERFGLAVELFDAAFLIGLVGGGCASFNVLAAVSQEAIVSAG